MSASGPDVWLFMGLGLGLAALMPAALLLVKRKKAATSENVLEELPIPGPAFNVYFGSQTGTAETLAQTIAAEGARHGYQINVVDLEDFNAEELLTCGKAIFLMATYGDGEPTDNAGRFSTWLANDDKELPEMYLASLSFTVFGLGNTQYEHYNMMGRTTNAGLEKLGAQRMYMYGEGDDDADLEGDFENWKEGLWEAVDAKFGGKSEVDGLEVSLSVPLTSRVISKEEAHNTPVVGEEVAASSTKFFWYGQDASVVTNRELRAPTPGVGSTRHIEIDLRDTGITYHTADNLAVLPVNDAAVVDKLCAQLDYDPDALFVLDHDASHKPVFPTPCTIRDALSRFMDIMSVPRRSLLEQLVPYVKDDSERERIHWLSSKDGRQDYHEVIEGQGWTLAELILEQIPSLSMTLDHFLHVIPHLHPRYYTISSSSMVSPSRVHITVSLLEQAMGGGRTYRGICSSFLSTLQPETTKGESKSEGAAGAAGARTNGRGPRCRVFVRESTFRLPSDTSKPILMIGPGTGVAPMRALLQERAWQRAQGECVGRSVLYFGCRSRSQDYIYRDELEAYVADGTLDKLRLAFSREGPSKVYVQHLLHEDASAVWDAVAGGGYLYVCGGTHMGTDVQHELTRILQEQGRMSEMEAKALIRELHSNGRYVQELWS